MILLTFVGIGVGIVVVFHLLGRLNDRVTASLAEADAALEDAQFREFEERYGPIHG